MRLSTKRRSISIAIMAMMVLAILFKALVPAGFMPDTQNGLTKLVICSGMGEKTVFVPSDEQKDHSTPDKLDHCPYQTLTTAKAIPAPAPFVLLNPPVISAPQPASQSATLSDIHRHSVGLRGPPLA